MSAASTIDLLMLGLYAAFIAYVAVRSARGERSEEFLIGGRSLGPWTSAAATCASKTGAGVFLTHMALVQIYGVSALWSFIGASTGYIAFFFFAGRLKDLADEHRYYTLSDYFFSRRGQAPGYASAVSLSMIYVLGFSGQLIGGSKILSMLSGLPYLVSLLIMTCGILLYVMVGGFKSVISTDVVQYIAVVTLTLLLGGILFFHARGGMPANAFHFAPVGSAALFLGTILLPFSSADLWQRVYATKGRSAVRRSLLYAMALYFSFGALLTAVGLSIHYLAPAADPDAALVVGFQRLLPPFLLGFAVILLCAGLMSSADTNLFTLSSILVQDFYGRIFGVRSKQTLTSGIRWVVAGIGVAGFLVAALRPHLVPVGFLWMSLNLGVGLMVLVSWAMPGVPGSALAAGLIAAACASVIASAFVSDERLVFVALAAAPSGALLWNGVHVVRLRRLAARAAARERVETV